jgi:hypothetical protein
VKYYNDTNATTQRLLSCAARLGERIRIIFDWGDKDLDMTALL